MQKLFLELLRVAVGQLDCLERGPSEEEWHGMYDMAHQHHMGAISYHGVERLYEFGLRAPQDIVLDWMAEGEAVGELDVDDALQKASPSAAQYDANLQWFYRPEHAKSPLRNFRLQRWLSQNKFLLSQYNRKPTTATLTLSVIGALLQAHDDLMACRSTLRPLLDAYFQLSVLQGRFADFRNGKSFDKQLSAIGMLRFARGAMWVMHEAFGLERKLMICEPDEAEGQFILQEMLSPRSHVWQMLRRYPLGMFWALF